VFPEAAIVSVVGMGSTITEYILTSEQDLPPQLADDLAVAIYRSPLLTEAVLYHRPSRTLLVADSAFKVLQHTPSYHLPHHVVRYARCTNSH
jgi:hypothetical protein